MKEKFVMIATTKISRNDNSIKKIPIGNKYLICAPDLNSNIGNV